MCSTDRAPAALEYTVAAVLQQDGFKVKRTGNAGSRT